MLAPAVRGRTVLHHIIVDPMEEWRNLKKRNR